MTQDLLAKGAGVSGGASRRRLVLTAVCLAMLLVWVGLALYGIPYYLTPLVSRPRHALYWVLKPGGSLGLAYGYLGAGMMVLLPLYSLRKRVRGLHRLGSAAVWLDYHILLGVFGPLFILLHSSFKVRGLVAVSFWSMVAVALSGVMGRFLYALIPHSRVGEELSVAQILKLDQQLSRHLVEKFRLPSDFLERLESVAVGNLDPQRSLISLLLRMPTDIILLRFRLRRLLPRQRIWSRMAPGLGRRLRRAVLRKAVLRRRLLLLDRVRSLFRYWHVVHKPLAIIMYLFAAVHIAVAWTTGYGGLPR
jgi:hypothetical protein